MPWDCRSCGKLVEKDDMRTCPDCGSDKASWTVVADKTRDFRVTTRRNRVQYLRAEGRRELTQDGPGYADLPTVEIEEAVSLPKPRARRIADRGKLPPPEEILVVRMLPRKKKPDLTVYLTPEFETQAMEEQSFPQDAPPKTRQHDAHFVFVHGEGSAEQIAFPGLSVVDLTEDSPSGLAPRVGARALTKKRKVLPVRALRPAYFYSL